MSKVAAAVAVLLGLALAAVVGVGLAIGNGWGPFEPEVAFGPDEVLTADGTVVIDDWDGSWTALDLDVPSLEPCPADSMPIPEELASASRNASLDVDGDAGMPAVILPGASSVTVACFGRVTSVGTPEDIARARQADTDAYPLQLSPVRVTGPFGEAVRWTGSVSADGQGLWLTEWLIDHDGMLLTVGYMRDSADPDRTGLVEQMLAGLTWSD